MYSSGGNIFNFIKRYPVVALLTVAIILVQSATYIYGNGPTDTDTAHRFGAIRSGETGPEDWFRLTAYLFVQIGGTMHLASNLLCLIVFGPLLEKIYGSVRFLFLYLVTGLFGGIFVLLFSSNVIAAGASGSLFGLMGVYLGLIIKEHDLMDVRNKMVIWTTCIFNIAYTFYMPGISIAGHLGGLFSGFILSFFVPVKSSVRDRDRYLLNLCKIAILTVVWFGALIMPQHLPDSILKSRVVKEAASSTNAWASKIKHRLPGNKKNVVIDQANWLNGRYNQAVSMLNQLIDLQDESNQKGNAEGLTPAIKDIRNKAESIKNEISGKELNTDMGEPGQALINMLAKEVQAADALTSKVPASDHVSGNRFAFMIYDIRAEARNYHNALISVYEKHGIKYKEEEH